MQKFLISALVARQRLCKTILTVIDIGSIQLHSRSAPVVPQVGKDSTRLLGRRTGTLILAQQDECLDRTAERPAYLSRQTRDFKFGHRLFEEIHCGFAITLEPECVRLG